MRIIEVKACNPQQCPLCMPDGFADNINYCLGLSIKKLRKVKTFPKCCPLKIIKEQA